jgi:UDP-N-acetylmuramate--alanine ligase
MSGLAEYALQLGCEVSGSDTSIQDTTTRLESLGATIFPKHAAGNIQGADEVIFSSAIKEDNVELAAARSSHLPLLHRSQLLAHFMKGKNSVTVAGTHGKTTTAALITHVLASCGVDPGAIIGGVMLQTQSNIRSGGGNYFVAEADESDGSFLNYEPVLAALTNIDRDHLDFYGTFENVKNAFRKYLMTSDPDVGVVCCWDDQSIREVSEGIGRPRLTYGTLLGCEVRAIDIQQSGMHTTFTAVVERDRFRCKLPLTGRHNVLNALCSLAVARALGLDVRDASQTLETFKGVARRMELLAETPDTLVFDDYAHNPGKIQACISGARAAWPSRQITVVHQPHRFSRLETMYDLMAGSFRGANDVILLPVYAAGESPARETDLDAFASDLALSSSTRTHVLHDKTAACRLALQLSRHPAIILTIGAGDVWKVGHMLREQLVG